MSGHKGGRERTGKKWQGKDLVWRWRGTIGPKGSTKQKTYNLGTKDPFEADIKIDRIINGDTPIEPEEASAPITIAEFAEKEFLQPRERLKLTTVDYERRYIEQIWNPAFGHKAFADVKVPDVQRVLDDLAAGKILAPPNPKHKNAKPKRYKYTTRKHIRDTAKRLWLEAMAHDLAQKNVPALAKLRRADDEEETLPRALPSDEEISRVIHHSDVDPEIKVITLTARMVGGMRAGDINALHFVAFTPGYDVRTEPSERWVILTFTRRKTRKKRPLPESHVIHPDLRPYFDAWHERLGRPMSGPVFPVSRGPRAGQQKNEGNNSYAKRFRRALLVAGVTRHELHHKTETSLPTDFHNLRRSFGEAGERAGLTGRQIMNLGGWSDPAVANRYRDKLKPKELPDAMVPPNLQGHADSIRTRKKKPRKPTPQKAAESSNLQAPADSSDDPRPPGIKKPA